MKPNHRGDYPILQSVYAINPSNLGDMASEECSRVLLGTAAVLRRLGDYQHAATLNRQALVIHDGPVPDYADQAEYVIRQLSELRAICQV